MYPSYFQQIAGFFIVENNVMQTREELVSPSILEGLWEVALERMKSVLAEQFNHCEDLKLILKLKDFMSLFIRLMSSYGLKVTMFAEFFTLMKTKHLDVSLRIADESLQEVNTHKHTHTHTHTHTCALALRMRMRISPHLSIQSLKGDSFDPVAQPKKDETALYEEIGLGDYLK